MISGSLASKRREMPPSPPALPPIHFIELEINPQKANLDNESPVITGRGGGAARRNEVTAQRGAPRRDRPPPPTHQIIHLFILPAACRRVVCVVVVETRRGQGKKKGKMNGMLWLLMLPRHCRACYILRVSCLGTDGTPAGDGQRGWMDGWMPVTDGGARVVVARDEAGFSGTAGFLGIWAGRHRGWLVHCREIKFISRSPSYSESWGRRAVVNICLARRLTASLAAQQRRKLQLPHQHPK